MKTKAKTKGPTAAQLTERLETLERRIRLCADTWRGYAAHKELAGADPCDPGVCQLHNCAMDLERLLSRTGRAA